MSEEEINYEIDNCITDLDTLIVLDKRAMKDLKNNTHEIEQQEVLTIIREFIRLRNDYQKEKEKNNKMISKNIYLKEELRKTNRYSLQIEQLRNQNAELRDELEVKNAELNKEKEKNKFINEVKALGTDDTVQVMLNKTQYEVLLNKIVNSSNLHRELEKNIDKYWRSKIKAKIEEIESKYNEIHSKHYRDCGIAEAQEKAKIQVLQELLEEEE